MTEYCEELIFGSGRLWGGERCLKKVKVQIEGKSWCSIHSPEAKEHKQAKQRARWDASDKARDEAIARDDRLTAAQDGVVKALEDVLWMLDNTASRTDSLVDERKRARVALDELRDAKAPAMTEEETESEKRQGAADVRREDDR